MATSGALLWLKKWKKEASTKQEQGQISGQVSQASEYQLHEGLLKASKFHKEPRKPQVLDLRAIYMVGLTLSWKPRQS